MKLILTKIFLFISLISYSQIDSNFEKVQKKFGTENISESLIGKNRIELKNLSENETIKITYNSENIVKMIEVENSKSIDNDRFHRLVKELNPKFKLTSAGNAENLNFYYDSRNKLLNIKVYKTKELTELNKVIFISDPKIISEFIPDIKNWK